MDGIAIEAKDLTRRFGKFVAVEKVNFTIRYGEIFGFLGANGAGKSTTVRMLCGILMPSEGTAIIGGYDVSTQPEQIKQSIGYVSQRFSLYTDLTVEENLRFYGEIYGVSGDSFSNRLGEVMTATGLTTYKDRLAAELSGGWRQKLALANAILHKPRILFLDEPTAGIDPLFRRAFWELLYQLADEGVALFITTHYMEEAERCNQIAFISQGKLLKIGTPVMLKKEVSGQLLEVECQPLMKASKVLQGVPGVAGVTTYGTTLHLNVLDPQAVQARLPDVAARNGITITLMRPITASLEDVFASLEGTDDEKH
ncbi:MAG: ABC transporter ATP-binding protein [Candidatus Omnitrophica bacterium]|nr:ABC transporter ATP-binding protein [Candidatus Omnitrophota bacterium]